MVLTTRRIEQWIWALIYGGLIALSLGWFIVPHDGPWGEMLFIGGIAAAAVGVFLIVVRSRIKDPPP